MGCVSFPRVQRFALERPDSNLQKHTSVPLGGMVPAFLCVPPPVSPADISQGLHEAAVSSLREMSLKESTQHADHMAGCSCEGPADTEASVVTGEQ